MNKISIVKLNLFKLGDFSANHHEYFHFFFDLICWITWLISCELLPWLNLCFSLALTSQIFKKCAFFVVIFLPFPF